MPLSLQWTQTLLDCSSIAPSGVRVSVNPSKSRNLVSVEKKVLNESVLLTMINKYKCSIPSILEKPVKFLGRTILDYLLGKHHVENLFLSVNKSLALKK